MTDACPARPSHRNVAGFGQFEQAAEVGAPTDIQAAACKGDQRTRFRTTLGRMRRAALPRHDTRSHGRAGAEHLGMNVVRCDTQRLQAGCDIVHEGRRSADVVIAIQRQAKVCKHPPIEVAPRVKIHARPIVRVRRAVADVMVCVRERPKQHARLPGERMFAAATGAVQPPDLACRGFGRRRMKHREDGRGSDPGA
jgi:hypothetical protein